MRPYLLALTLALQLTPSLAFAIDEPTPIPSAVSLPRGRVVLGNRLFHDPRLSADNTIACASCHALRLGGADRAPQSTGIANGRGSRNSPTVYNSGFLTRLFWDGRASSLEAQIDGPVHNAVEMGSSWPEIVAKLSVDRHYAEGFAREYGEKISERTIKDAIATFERSLVTPDSPFDRYLRGETQALTSREREGYRRFREVGCMSCHDGMLFGGRAFIGELRVPPLRNVEATPPYFHDGRAKSLEAAVDEMLQRFASPSARPDDRALIVGFLKTLTGNYLNRPLNDWTHPRTARKD